MSQTLLGKTKRSLTSFAAILALFLIVGDGFVITQQSHFLHTEMNTHTKHEFNLFSKLVADALTKGDYAAVEEAATLWGNERPNILELTITAANGFTIAHFDRDKPVAESKQYTGTLEFGLKNAATITMTKDMASVNAVTYQLASQLIVFSLILVAALGILLQRMAIRPLQQEIINHEKTEKKLHQHAAELRDSNNELESYSYSIAHDLRAPLRSITSFSQILQEDAHHKLSDEEKNYFARIIAASKRMAALIDDILELGRITRSKLEPTKVDLSALARNIMVRLFSEHNGRKVDWQIQEDITATGDVKLFTVLLENLLGNAYKFSSKKNPALIEFGKTNTLHDGINVSAYFVKDNGAGFEMRHANKLYQPFVRLCDKEEFEGTGVGLATVQRIVRRHGGQIWATAKPNEGATFFFTLPGGQ